MPSSSPPPINNKPPMDQKPSGQLADPHPLKCPRCDSSNTKFCYYNNYSLSQPRHFCKACKRYWTRGGTLRNVPVGGGCRKNKRTKRPLSNDAVSGQSTAIATASAAVQRPLDLAAAASHNHLFYNPIELNFPFSNFRVSNTDQNNNSGFDFSSSGLNVAAADHHVGVAAAMSSDFKNGFKPIQDPFMFGSNSNFGSTSSTMASLLAMKGVMPYEDPGKDVKLEGGNRPVWNPNPNPNPIHDQINNNNPSDPSSSSTSFVWNNTNLGAWFDPSSMGSSVPSLI